MAISITVAELAGAIRAGSTTLETAEITRLRLYAIEAITRHLGLSYETVPETAVNEATIRLVGYIYDRPTAARGAAWANAGRNSGAWSTLLPYVVHRAGGVAQATAAAQAAVGSAGNPVVGVSVDATAATLTVIFADGTAQTENLPAGGMGGGAGLDQTARDAAAAAQASATDAGTAAAAAQSSANAAAATAVTAQGTADLADSTATRAEGKADANASAIAAVQAIPHVFSQRTAPSGAKAGDLWFRDLATVHPTILEHNGTSWVQDFAFYGGRVHFTHDVHNLAMDQPASNAGDLLFQVSASSEQLNIYRRLNASSSPFWDYVGEVTGGGTGGGGLPTVQVDEINMIGSAFANLGAGRTLKVAYPSGTTRESYQGRCVDCHIFAAVTGNFPQGSRVLTLSGASFWLSEGGVGTQWNVLLQDDGIRMFIPFAVTLSAITAATVYLARMVI